MSENNSKDDTPGGTPAGDSQDQDSVNKDTADDKQDKTDFEKRFKDTQAALTKSAQEKAELQSDFDVVKTELSDIKRKISDDTLDKQIKDKGGDPDAADLITKKVAKALIETPEIQRVTQSVELVERLTTIEQAKQRNPDFEELRSSGLLDEALTEINCDLTTFTGDVGVLTVFIKLAREKMKNKKLEEAKTNNEKTIQAKEQLNQGNFTGVTEEDLDKEVETPLGNMDAYSASFMKKSKFTVNP